MNKQKTGAGFILPLLIVVCGIALITSQKSLSLNQTESVEKEQDLYLPEANVLKFISLGHNGLMSDLILAKALTYYGSHYRERQTFGFKHLKKLFVTAVEMDPMNKDAFLLAGNVLSDIDIRSAIEILKLGMYYHPQSWKFPEMIGFQYFFKLNDPEKAAAYYEIASRLPGHPPYVPSLSGKFYEESGRYEEAIRALYNFYSTTTDERLKQSFKASIDEILEKIKKRDFQLKAEVLSVLDGETVGFKPDARNPQFQFLKSSEILRLKAAPVFDLNSSDIKERLFAFMQRDYARYMLENSTVFISFDREPDGSLKRDKRNYLSGKIALKNNIIFKQIEINDFPPKEERLIPGKVYLLSGKIATLRYTVQRVEFGPNSIYLNSGSGYRNSFRAVIPNRYTRDFIGFERNVNEFFKRIEGKEIVVSGLALNINRVTEMNLYSSAQLGLKLL